jgi:hypothetical protein
MSEVVSGCSFHVYTIKVASLTTYKCHDIDSSLADDIIQQVNELLASRWNL